MLLHDSSAGRAPRSWSLGSRRPVQGRIALPSENRGGGRSRFRAPGGRGGGPPPKKVLPRPAQTWASPTGGGGRVELVPGPQESPTGSNPPRGRPPPPPPLRPHTSMSEPV